MSNRKLPNMPQVKYSVTTLGGGETNTGVSYPGGLDLVTPSMRLQPGAVRDGVNFECMQSGGYGRIVGYERYSGQPSPSDATYLILQFLVFNYVPKVGQKVVQDVTGATGTIFEVAQGVVPPTVIPPGGPPYLGDPEGGFVGDPEGGYVGDPEGGGGGGGGAATSYSYIAVTQVTGQFDTIHNVNVIGVGFAFGVSAFGGPDGFGGVGAIGIPIPTWIYIDPETDARYLADAADVYRALIGPVPGQGAVLGVVHIIFAGVDNVYAFRANLGSTQVNIYKATPTGWALVPYGYLISWTAGSAMPFDGDTLTQGSVTATIKRVMWQAGAFAPPGPGSLQASGDFVITNIAGGNFTAGPATTSSGGAITLSGVQTLIAPSVGIGIQNRYEFVKCNFSGQLRTRRIYGCDGVNPPFEFDGDTYAPIATGLSPNRPSHIYFHKEFLFISQESSLLYCGVGTPFKWDAVDGGGEIATSDQVTGMLTLPGSQTTATMGVFLKNNTGFLYGTDPSTFNFVLFNTGLGALQYSLQNLFDTFALDTLGVITLRTTLNWGNFLPTTLTKNMLPFILQERENLTASCIFREKSSYRLFFRNGYGLWLTMINQQYLGGLPVLFPNPVYVVDEDVSTTEEEVLYFGSSDNLGYVYQMEKGTSFDGMQINAYIDMAWDFIKSPRILKRFRAASVELQGYGFARFDFGYQLGWDAAEVAQPDPNNLVSSLSAISRWDQIVWDQFVWDGTSLFPSEVDMTGTAENVRVIINVTTNYIKAFTVNSVIYHYTMQRGIRV